MGVRINFSRGSNLDILLILFRLLTMQCKCAFTKGFALSAPKRNCAVLRVTTTVAKIALSWRSNSPFSFVLLFTQYKTTKLTAVSSHCVAAFSAKDVCVQQSHMCQNAYYRNLKRTSEDLLPYCYAIKANNRTIRSQVL